MPTNAEQTRREPRNVAPDAPGAPDAPSNRRLLRQFVIGAVVAVAAITALTWLGLGRVLESELKERARVSAERATQAIAALVSANAHGAGEAEWAALDARVRPVMDACGLIRVRVFGPGEALLYTSEDSDQGRRAPLEQGYAPSMRGAMATIVAPAHIVWREPRSETYARVLAATYIPVRDDTGTVGASVEACADVTRERHAAAVTLRRSVSVVFAALALAFLALTAVMHRAQRVIVEGAQALGEARARTRAEETLRAVVEATAGATGEAFFQALAATLAERFGARWAYAIERGADGEGIRTLALAGPGAGCERLARALTNDERSNGRGESHEQGLRAAGVVGRASAPMRGADGETIGEIGVLHDGPLALEAHDASILDILATRAGAEVERERWHQSVERTRERFRLTERLASIGALAAGVGHDLNNLLLPMRGQVRALLAMPQDETAAAQLRALAQSIEFLRQLGENLRLLADGGADVRAATAASTQESTRLGAWWGQIGPMLSRAIPKSVSLEVSLPESLPAVAVAPARLTQAALNLLVNAGDAIESGGQGVVRLWAEADDAGTVLLRVRDNGRGMNAATLRHAFDPFFTTKPRGASTGLGLALVQQIAGSAGGTVEIESVEGAGTTVTLRVPQAQEQRPTTGGPRIALTLSDGRTAAYARALLATEGLHVAFAPGVEPPSDADVWIVDDDAVDLASALAFLNARPGRRALAVGQPPPSWREAGVVVVGETLDRDTLRAALGALGNGNGGGNGAWA